MEVDETIPELPVKDVVSTGYYNNATLFANALRFIVYTEVRKGFCT